MSAGGALNVHAHDAGEPRSVYGNPPSVRVASLPPSLTGGYAWRRLLALPAVSTRLSVPPSSSSPQNVLIFSPLLHFCDIGDSAAGRAGSRYGVSREGSPGGFK